MSARILWENIGCREIGWYLSVPLVLALVAIALPAPAWFEASAFGLLVLFWSVMFPMPRFGGALPTRAVDFWYYTFAIFGVLLFFIASAADREKVILREEYQAQLRRAEEAAKRLVLLHTVPQRAEAIQAQMRERARSLAGNPDIAVQQCQAAQLRRFDRQLELITARAPAPGEMSLPRIDDASAVCSIAVEQLGWSEIANASDRAGFLAAIDRSPSALKVDVTVGDRALPLSEVRAYLPLAPGSEELGSAIAKQTKERDEGIAKANAASHEFQSLGGAIESPFILAAAEKAARFAWPFILITALGMKLARQPYAYKADIDRCRRSGGPQAAGRNPTS